MECAIDATCEAAESDQSDDDLDGDSDHEAGEAREQSGPHTGTPGPLVTSPRCVLVTMHNAAQTRVTPSLHPILVNGQQRSEPRALKKVP